MRNFLSPSLLAALLLATAPLMAVAQEELSSSPRVMSLQECLDYAAEHNISVRQSRLSVDQAAVDIYSAEGQLLPSLSFGLNQGVSWRPWSKSYVNVSNGTMTQTSSELNYNGTYGLSAQWDIWNGGRNRKQVERSKTALRQAETNVESSLLTVQEQIVEAYVRILYQTEAVKVNKEILDSTMVQYRRTKEMVEVGSLAQADLAQMEAQVSQCEYNVANSQTQLASYKLGLKQLLQITDTDQFDVAVPSIDDGSVMAPLPGIEQVYNEALAQRPEIRSADISLQLADIDVDIAKRQKYPTIGMSAGINTSNTSGMDDKFYNQWKTNLSNSLGVSLSLPIFDNRASSSATRRARLSQLSSQLELEQKRSDLFNTVEQIWLDADNAKEQYRYALANVKAMQTSYDLVSEQYSVGLKDIVDLTTGRINLVQALQQLLQSKYTAILNRALLSFYQGNPLTLTNNQ